MVSLTGPGIIFWDCCKNAIIDRYYNFVTLGSWVFGCYQLTNNKHVNFILSYINVRNMRGKVLVLMYKEAMSQTVLNVCVCVNIVFMWLHRRDVIIARRKWDAFLFNKKQYSIQKNGQRLCVNIKRKKIHDLILKTRKFSFISEIIRKCEYMLSGQM